MRILLCRWDCTVPAKIVKDLRGRTDCNVGALSKVPKAKFAKKQMPVKGGILTGILKKLKQWNKGMGMPQKF